VATRFARHLKSDEQPYVRTGVKVGGKWQPISLGWLGEEGGAGVSDVAIENLEGTGLQVIPTLEEAADISKRVLEVSVAGKPCGGQTSWDEDDQEEEPQPGFIVRPGEGLRLTPVDASLLRIRCLHGSARVCLTVYPA
jgi:hypothetical protein